MEIVAKENMVTVMDHHEGRKTREFVEDPMAVPRKIMEQWNPQRIDELPDAFCGTILRYLFIAQFYLDPNYLQLHYMLSFTGLFILQTYKFKI